MSRERRACQRCNASFMAWPSETFRKFCSPECRYGTDPVRFCESCGTRMTRRRFSTGLLESRNKFRDRRTCSAECRKDVSPNRLPNDPNNIGQRPLLARTCSDCGRLKPPSAFRLTTTGYRTHTCIACAGVRWREVRSDDARMAANTRALERLAHYQRTTHPAAHWGDEWTGPELELIATRPDLSVTDLALMLGRTYHAVVAARAAVRRDPGKAWLAGATS